MFHNHIAQLAILLFYIFSILDRIQRRQLKWYGKLLRMEESCFGQRRFTRGPRTVGNSFLRRINPLPHIDIYSYFLQSILIMLSVVFIGLPIRLLGSPITIFEPQLSSPIHAASSALVKHAFIY